MTRRAARMLAALEAGCRTRNEIFDHQDRFSLLNNGAAELRAAGIEVVCELVAGDYVYRLLDQGHEANGAGDPPPSDVSLIEETDTGQMALVAA